MRKEVKMPPTMGAAICFMTSEPVPIAHMIGSRPRNMVATVMTFGRSRFTAPSRIAWRSSSRLRETALLPGLRIGKIQIEEHEDPGLGIDAEERNQADPDPDTHVVAEQIEKPDRADGGKRHREQDDQGLHHRAGIEIEQDQDEKQGQGDDHRQPLPDPLHGLVLAAPGDGVARGKFDLLPDQLSRPRR